ncbi:hypothetical protein TIFTF001_012593 [Ficus carica]|uniref:Uncharacterized protein n=1 Tax=Ficus carica TaxID=3494 RepID=A0AA87ZZ99_FICCA|nr:hypothetical protein TIFTF001_012593 [Ficus carica]
MTTKKDVGSIEHEVILVLMELENTFKHVIQRLSDMKQYSNSGSASSDELEALKIIEKKTRENQEQAFRNFSKLRREYFDPQQDPKTHKPLSRNRIQAMKLTKEKLEKILSNLQARQIYLDHQEEKFRKYNVPRRDVHRSSPESFECYLERLRKFMQVTWKEAAEKCRRKEHRSFIEWMVKLEQSEEHETRTTFEVLRGVLIEIGIQISHSLIEYLLIMSVSAEREEMAMSIYEVESMIRCLSVEENSIVIDSFLSVVKLFERATKLANPYMAETEKEKRSKKIKKDDARIEKENNIHCPFSDQDTEDKCNSKIEIKKDDSQIEKEINVPLITSLVKDANGKHEKMTDKVKKDDSLQIEKENDLLHLIIIEVLRLEIGFRIPDLPMMVSNEVYMAMGEHLMENVFEDRMSSLSAKIDELKLLEVVSVGEKDSMRKSFEQELDVGVKESWNKLDLKL